ncbi:MAG: GNAT family N-acetyltransferase [Solirubrobacterales bacterium]|nr:GNAT family N-acetyltransferase [Solirubrobacterales bacterium]
MTLALRPIRRSDADRLRRFHERLSEESIYLRYHSPHPRLKEREVRQLVGVDAHDHVAWVACDDDGEIAGVARVIRNPVVPETGEVAIVIADGWHRHGLGARLVERVLSEARREGMTTVVALVLAHNEPARQLFVTTAERLGIPCASRWAGGVVELSLDVSALRPAALGAV